MAKGIKTIKAYRIIKKLEETNTAIIYKVQDRSKDYRALKIARLNTEEHNALIIREFQILNQIKHPTIVRVMDLDTDPAGRTFFLQPFLPGKAIDTCFSSLTTDLMNALLEIINAVAVLHNRGFIHGDLKPEHLLYDAKAKNIVLIDFGYARVPDDPSIRTGTIGYIAPEVIKGVGLDQRSDIYSLGVIIHKIIAGKLVDAQWQDIPGIPDTINALVRRMCAREPAVRPLITEIHEVLRPYATFQEGAPRYDVSLPPSTFVGRSTFMEELTHAAGTAHTICGEAGTGKTRFLCEMKYRFMQLGYRTFYYCAGEQVSIFGALCEFLKIQKADIIEENDKYAVFQNVFTALQQYAVLSPLVLLIDDVETMKDFDRALLRYIGFGLKETHTGIVCTTTDPRIAVTIGFDTLTLDPLTTEETEHMVTQTLCPLEFGPNNKDDTRQYVFQWLHEQSGGKPLYLVKLLTILFEQDILMFSRHRWHIDCPRLDQVHIPEHLENHVFKRYDHLTEYEQTVLQTMALATIPMDPGILAAAFGNECFTSLEVLKHSRLIKEDYLMNNRVVFIPDNIPRKLVRSRISTRKKNKLRKRLIQALEHTAFSDPGYITLLATLYDAIDDHDKAIEYAGRAAQHAEAECDYITALDYHRIILKNTPERTRAHGTTALKIAELLTTMGQCKEAIAVYQDLHDRAARVFHKQIITGIGRAYYHMGNFPEAVTHLRKALNIYKKKITSEPAVDIQTRLAYCLSVTGEFAEAEHLIDQAIKHAKTIGNARLISAALYYKAVLQHQQGKYDQSIRSAEDHIQFSDQHGIHRGSALSTLLLSRIYQEQNDLDKALHHVDAAIADLEKSRDINALLNALDCKATILFYNGEIPQARALYASTLRKAKQIDYYPIIINCLSALSTIDIMMGKFDQALASAQEGFSLSPDTSHFIINMVDIHIARGDIEKADTILEMVSNRTDDPHYHRAALHIAAEKKDLLNVRNHLENFTRIDRLTDVAQQSRLNSYFDLMSNLYEVQEYQTCAIYADKILATSSPQDIYHSIAQAYMKLTKYYISNSLLDISPEIEHLRRASVIYEMIRLQRLKIQALLTTQLTGLAIRDLSRELLDCYEIAHSIQAQQEITHLRELQHELFSLIIHEKVTGSTSNEYLIFFSQIAALIERHLGDDGFLKNLLDIVVRATRAERGALFLNTPQGIEFIVGRDIDQTTIQDAAELSRTAIRDIHKEEIVFTHNAQSDPDFNINKSVVLNKIRSLLCIPLTIEDNVIGALYLDSRFEETMFSQHDKDFLLTVARILAAVIDRSRAIQKIIDENAALRTSVIADIGQGYLISTSRAMKKVYDLINQVAATNSPVLLIGETGTGKGMLARLIHQRSARKNNKFTVINCGTIPETLLESELFGHKKGAFTGALTDKPGLLEYAHGGTVFLDELTNTSPAFQAKLLEAIEDKVIRRVGETRTYTIDVRFIFATNKDLEIEVEEGRFRKDLYYRINVFKIEIPPLRERGSDIILLARFFLEMSSKEIGKKVIGFTPQSIQLLRSYHWAGNVRELRHVVERAVVLAKGVNITHHELNLDARESREGASIQEIKKEAVCEALEATNYNTSKAARLLGVNRRTIQRYRKKYNL
ncbi:sigma 54-interacting transcriptional regulator [candidate division WOR-3 bacterium]|nr:sigma 54-interacting transcriptional regulator [candidate division WOR-3 bacterium]